MQFTQEQLNLLEQQVKTYYSSLDNIYCPYFGEKVSFSSDGFMHMLYRRTGAKLEPRDMNSQYMRLKLFKLVPKLLGITKTVQDYCIHEQFIPVTHNHRQEKVLRGVHYWGFIAIIDRRRIKVIVKQIGNGQKRFWSIIPNWITRKTDRGTQIFRHTGDLEND